MTPELVVLLDEAGNAVGRPPSATCTTRARRCTWRSPATSSTRRARCSSPGGAAQADLARGGTNSVCGHRPRGGPRRRRGAARPPGLGIAVSDLRLALPAFRYEAVMADGVRENEMCPVFTAVTADEVRAAPDEVEAVAWEPWEAFRDGVLAGRREVSPWCVEQVALLRELAPVGLPRVAGDPSLLPPAARGDAPWARAARTRAAWARADEHRGRDRPGGGHRAPRRLPARGDRARLPGVRRGAGREWTRHHTAHSRRITPLVVGVYAAVVAACGWVLVAGGWQPSTAVAVAASALAMLTTAAVAAPAHGRLGAGRGERDLAVLVRADRVRLAASSSRRRRRSARRSGRTPYVRKRRVRRRTAGPRGGWTGHGAGPRTLSGAGARAYVRRRIPALEDA